MNFQISDKFSNNLSRTNMSTCEEIDTLRSRVNGLEIYLSQNSLNHELVRRIIGHDYRNWFNFLKNEETSILKEIFEDESDQIPSFGFYKSAINFLYDLEDMSSTNLDFQNNSFPIMDINNLIGCDVGVGSNAEEKISFLDFYLFWNLYKNAGQVGSSREIFPKVNFRYSRGVLERKLEVYDNVGGIDKKVVPNIFKDGFSDSNNYYNKGFGLYGVRELVNMFGGSMIVHSRFGDEAKYSYNSMVNEFDDSLDFNLGKYFTCFEISLPNK